MVPGSNCDALSLGVSRNDADGKNHIRTALNSRAACTANLQREAVITNITWRREVPICTREGQRHPAMAGAAHKIEPLQNATGGPVPGAATLARLNSHVRLPWARAAEVERESLDIAFPGSGFGSQIQQGRKHEQKRSSQSALPISRRWHLWPGRYSRLSSARPSSPRIISCERIPSMFFRLASPDLRACSRIISLARCPFRWSIAATNRS